MIRCGLRLTTDAPTILACAIQASGKPEVPDQTGDHPDRIEIHQQETVVGHAALALQFS